MATVSAAQFHENFWGTENKGYDVLLQNMKAGINASKELGEFVKERMVAEDTYVKGLSKLQKSVQHIPESTLGTFGPLWELLKMMCDKLVNVHTQFVKMLSELSREIMDYNHTQKEKMKSNMRGDIDHAQDALMVYQTTEASVQRSKKHYLQSAEEAIKARVKLDRVKVEASNNPKAKQRLAECEVRVKQSQSWMNTQKSDNQGVVKKHCGLLMEFQGKMSEACMRFESLEEENMAQMATFMIKVARTQDSTHTSLAEVFSVLNSELDTWTVEKLLKNFVAKKGTGKEKPTPQKFRDASSPPLILTSIRTQQISRSTEDLSVSERHGSKSERKGTFRPFSKKKKNSPSIASTASNGPTEPQIPEQVEVDEEGYSIRPEDAANVGKFPDDPWGKKENPSDSDSDDSEGEREKKLKKLRIRESSAQPAATIDDLKASVRNIKLGAVSPTGMRKASSSQSLNILSMSSSTNSTVRKMTNTSALAEGKQEGNKSQPSLLDLDTVFSSETGGSQMLTPLKPTSSTASKTPHIAAPLLPSPILGIRGAGSTNSGGGGPLIATTSFNAKIIDPSASLPAWSFSSPTPATTSSSSSILTPLSVSTASPNVIAASDTSVAPSPAASISVTAPVSAPSILDSPDPPIARRRSGSSEDPLLNSIPAPPLPTKQRRAVRGNGGVAGNMATNGTLLAPQTPPLQPVQLSNGQDSSSSSPIPGLQDLNSSDQTASLSDTPPMPAPRGASLLQTSRDSLSNSSISPLVASQTMNSSIQNKELVPLAIAVTDTCNALFKGVELESCVVKVSGEVAVSFPSSYLSKISPSMPLQFKVAKKGVELEKLLHNQHLLKKTEEEDVFCFDMAALVDYLEKMKEKDSKKSYYIIQILKYDLKLDGGGSQLPLQLKSYMKCEPTATNFRLDYSYHPAVFSSAGKKPTLSKVAFSLPMDGGVQNTLSKPDGMWASEKGSMTWTVGDLPPLDNPVSAQLQAKFSVANGPSQPSKAAAMFECEGGSMSGLSLELQGSGYKVYLFKERCLAGKYLTEPKL